MAGMGALGLCWRPHLPCPGRGEWAWPVSSSSRELLSAHPHPHPHPHRNQSHAADLVDGAVPRHCPSTSLCICACVHGLPNLAWQRSTPLPPPPPPCPLSPRDTDTHSRTASPCPWTLLEPMGSTAALQLCSTQMDLCVRPPSDHLTSPVRRRVLASWRPARPNDTHRGHRFYLFPGSTLLQFSGPKAPLMLQPEASLTSPSSCTSATTAMPPCPALPCAALSCPTLRTLWLPLAPPGSSSAPGLNWTCLFWVGLAWLTCRFFRLAAASLLFCLPGLQ